MKVTILGLLQSKQFADSAILVQMMQVKRSNSTASSPAAAQLVDVVHTSS
jgi:hypothetical protein